MKNRTIVIFFIMSFVISACANLYGVNPEIFTKPKLTSETATPNTTPTQCIEQPPTVTLTPEPSATRTQIPPTPTRSPTPSETPWSLTRFNSPALNPGVTPVTYLDDICRYLELRWGPGKSEPGTIVVPIMFHSVAKPGRIITDSTTITMAYFEYFMQTAKELGFETITMDELRGFLYENAQIPSKSMLLILDDRRPGVTELFMPYLEENNWTLTLAWPTTDATSDELWARMEGLAESGHLDIQSHGHDHIYIQSTTTQAEIEEEIYRPIEVIQDHFGTTPNAIIWPGGNFTQESARIAREAGLDFGFTVYSRGPLMFNWIPLGEPELAIGDPLMVLPRYWSTGADVALEHALGIAEEARLDAEVVRDTEQRYYETFCQSLESE